MEKKDWIERLGSFELTGDKLMVTDPCYTRGTWCQGVIDNCVPGFWHAWTHMTTDTDGRGTRVAELEAMAGLAHGGQLTDWVRLDVDVGVDSGQCGVFDDNLYPDGETGEYGDLTTFYGRACAATYYDDPANFKYGDVIAEGAVSSSGYGDGGYNAYVKKNSDGRVCAVKVVFIGDEDEQADDDEQLD